MLIRCRLRAFLLILTAPAAFAQRFEEDVRACSVIEDPTERVTCYDGVAGRIAPRAAGPVAQEAGEVAPEQIGTGPARQVTSEFNQNRAPSTEDAGSRITRYWELENEAQRGRFVMLPHRPNYILPATYNFDPNEVPFIGSDFELEQVEAKFQISFKFKLWQDIVNGKGDLWFAYTQQSYWQVYNSDSAPFRETNYEPSLFFTYPVDVPLFGLRARMVSLGFDHQSNGRGEPLSRSWNRIVAGALLERGNFATAIRAWYRVPEDDEDDDNPDIEDYLGNADIVLSYKVGRNEWSTTLKNNFDFDDNRSGVELAWSFGLPFTRNVSGYVQYYYGYGESLLDYDARVNRVGIGFLVSDWF